MPSFDIVSEVDKHEVQNAVEQAAREVATRYDFRDTGTVIEKNEEGIVIRSNSEGRIDAARDVLETKWVRRKLDIKALDVQEAQPAGGQTMRQLIKIREGVDKDHAKDLVRRIKDSKVKVQAAIQGDLVRVTGKKRDDLQEVISMLKAAEVDLPLQFKNFRE